METAKTVTIPADVNVMRHAYKVLTDEEKSTMQAIKDEGLRFHALVEHLQLAEKGQLLELHIAEETMRFSLNHEAT